ncbi:MAG: hypothetical protein ABI967_02005 [bacterium]
MRSITRTVVTALVYTLLLLVTVKTAPAQKVLPNPVLYLTKVETFQTGGKTFTRYRYAVANYEAYADALFAPSPTLPPCGANTRSARSWVDLFDQRGKRLYGFCALGSANDLNSIWFALESDVVPPSYIYIELNDRQTNTKYKSNLADTTL